MKSYCSRLFCLLLLCFAGTGSALAQQEYRTDDSTDEKLPWYQLQEGKFPPADAAHYFDGELIGIDHINRKARLRVSRTDRQNRSHWDLPVRFDMLPYGSIYYQGAPASFAEIPFGTHLHGWYFERSPDSPEPKSEFYNRKSYEIDFTRCLKLEDDFTYNKRLHQAWKVVSVDRDKLKLVCQKIDTKGENPPGENIEFDLMQSTMVWQEDRITDLSAIKEGQIAQLNLTWVTLYGPGRVTNIWVDEKAQQLATARQLKRHLEYQKARGLAGMIQAVDNENRKIKVVLFDGMDPELYEAFKPTAFAQTIVSQPNLRNYDQVNDRMNGKILSRQAVPVEPGSSGILVEIQVNHLLEGFRPHRIVRVFPGWPLQTLPKEENMWPRRD